MTNGKQSKEVFGGDMKRNKTNFFAVFVGALVASVVMATPALAATGHGFTASFGSEGSAAGQIEEPAGVAVNDKTHDVYVVDRGNNRIDEFESDGTFIRAWGWSVVEGPGKKAELQTCTILTGCGPGVAGTEPGQLDAPEAIAVDNSASASDPSKEDVYVTNTADNVIEKFSATGMYLGQVTTGQFGAAFRGLDGVAVDPEGKLWVYQASGEFDDYSDAGSNALLGHCVQEGTSPGFAVDAGDNLYVNRGFHRIEKLNHVCEVEEVYPGENATAVAVDSDASSPEFGDLYINAGTVVEVFDAATGAPVEAFGGARHPISGPGVAVDPVTGAVYVANTATAAVEVATLGEAPKEAPKTEPASGETSSEATFHGELNPHGATGTLEYQFDYNTGASCGGRQSTPVPAIEVSEAKQAVVEARATGLQPNAEYTYCLVAFNTFGEARGDEVPFKTLSAKPEVAAGSEIATNGSSTAMTLEAQVNPNNQPTKFSFEYSTQGRTGAGEKLAGSIKTVNGEGELEGFGEQTATVPELEGLSPGTLYFYRVVATNATGATVGPVEVFTTVPAPITDAPNPIAARTATFTGHFTLVATATQYSFRYEPGTECARTETPFTTTSSEAGTGPGTASATTPVTELAPNARYTVCLVTSNAYGSAQGPPVTFTTSASAPAVADQYATEVGALTATLNAEIDPGGVATSYSFEYGETSSYGAKIPLSGAALGPVTYGNALEPTSGNVTLSDVTPVAGPFSVGELIGGQGIVPGTQITAVAAESGGHQRLTLSRAFTQSGDTDVALFAVAPATQQLQGLQPDTIYHYRVVATNDVGGKLETVDGPDQTFTTTASVASSALPDNRAYEAVSLSDGGDGEVQPPQSDHQKNESREIATSAPLRASASGDAVDYAAGAPEVGGSGSTGYGYGNVFLASRGADGWSSSDIMPPLENEEVYRGFSDDLSLAVLFDGETPLTADAAPAPCDVLYTRGTDDGAYHAMFTAGDLQGTCEDGGEARLAGISADDSSVIFESPLALSSAATRGDPELIEETDNLYDSVAGHVYLVNVLPDGIPELNATYGGKVDIREEGFEPTSVDHDYADVISSDGSRVVWTDRNTGDLYVRENPASPDASTVLVATTALYRGASSDGSTILYTKGGDLYEFDLETDTTRDLAPAGAVLGVLGNSEDGSYVYFVAEKVLASNQSAHGERASEGQPNLYVSDAGETSFIATLSREDNTMIENETAANGNNFGDWRFSLMHRTAEVTPDGRSVVFSSRRSITGYDNEGGCRNADSELTGCPELFVYDAESRRLSCASCNPTGAPPEAARHADVSDAIGVGGAFLPVPTKGSTGAYQVRWISSDGDRVFFDTAEALVPKDTNGVQDVYEWERSGSGTCREPTACIYLISSDLSREEAYLLDASASGGDVFFTTRARLVPQDRDEKIDLYDAHECTSASPCLQTASLACAGAGCQGAPPAAPAYATPPSVTFGGIGNFTPVSPGKAKPRTAAQLRAEKLAHALKLCRGKHNKRKRSACERQARKRYGAATPSARKTTAAGRLSQKGRQ
jgi:hypothetical protein